jgi:hypothetical protein
MMVRFPQHTQYGFAGGTVNGSRSLPAPLILAALLGLASADEPPEISPQQRAAHLQHMREVAASIRLLAKPTRDDSAVPLREEPLLRYTDNTRFNYDSTLWIWAGGGRPTALAAVEYYPRHPEGPRWLFEVASLSTQPIAAQRDPDLHWTAKEPGLKLRPLDDARPIAEKATRRLSQMKEMCRRFTAHESAVVEGRVELRLLSSPLYRYADADAGVTDGAIFAFANGTNPEVLLVLEAHGGKDKDPWHYALVQMTGGAVSVELDSKEVWQREEADPPAVRPSYVNGWISSASKELKNEQ